MTEQQGAPSQNAERVSVEGYAAFIRQIELLHIWLHSAHVANMHGPDTPEHVSIQVDSDARCEARSSGFRAFQCYKLRFQTTDTLLAEVEATFGLDFASNESMTDGLFALFGEVNLPVNTWPYLREFVATVLGRMGWTVVTLPALKVGTSVPSRRDAERRPPRARSRSARTTVGRTPSRTRDNVSHA